MHPTGTKFKSRDGKTWEIYYSDKKLKIINAFAKIKRYMTLKILKNLI